MPLGTPQFVRDYALARLDEHEAAHVRVRVLSCVQCAYVLLRLCLGARFLSEDLGFLAARFFVLSRKMSRTRRSIGRLLEMVQQR